MTTTTLAAPAVISAWDVGALPWVRPDGTTGVRVRTLWESPASRAVLVLLDQGAGFSLHVHPEDDHHAYVLEGRCSVGGRSLAAGSYVHTLAGEPHDVRGECPFGTKVLYVFERGTR